MLLKKCHNVPPFTGTCPVFVLGTCQPIKGWKSGQKFSDATEFQVLPDGVNSGKSISTRLPDGYDYEKSLICTSRLHSGVLAAGRQREGGNYRINLALATHSLKKLDKSKGQTEAEDWSFDNDWLFNLAEAEVPKQLLYLDNGVVLILNDKGDLHYWVKGRGFNYPKPINNAWNPIESSHLIAGTQGWFARVANQKLSMWNIRVGGHLSSYSGEPLSISLINDPKTLMATGDGRYLIAAEDKMIFKWNYPQYRTDRFSGA